MVYLHQTTRCHITEDSTIQHKFPSNQGSTAPTRKFVPTTQTESAASHFCSSWEESASQQLPVQQCVSKHYSGSVMSATRRVLRLVTRLFAWWQLREMFAAPPLPPHALPTHVSRISNLG